MGGDGQPGPGVFAGQPEDPGPEPAHGHAGRLEVQQRDGEPVLDGIAAALLGPPEPVHLHQPQRPVAPGGPLVAFEQGVVLAEGGGHVLDAVGGDEPEVAELVGRLGIDDGYVLLILLEAVQQAPPDVVGGLGRPGGVGMAEHHRLPGLDPLGQRPAVGVGLPDPLGGEARVGGVALRLAVADQVDVVEQGPGRGRRGGDLLVAVVLGEGLLHPEAGPGPQRAVVGRVAGRGGPAPESLQVQGGGRVVGAVGSRGHRRIGLAVGAGGCRRGGCAGLADLFGFGLPAAEPGQVQRGLDPVDRLGAPGVHRGLGHRGPSLCCQGPASAQSGTPAR